MSELLTRWHKLTRRKQWLFAIGFLVLALTGIGALSGGSDDTTPAATTAVSSDPAVESNERTVGNPAVLARIENGTSCTALQREFDIAMDNAEAREPGDPMRDISMTYADAADNRLDEIGCYG